MVPDHGRWTIDHGRWVIVYEWIPRGRVEIRPMHEGKGTVDARGNVACHQGSFDGNGAGTAEGIQQGGLLIPAGGDEHGSGEGFAQGSLGNCQAVAALVQRFTRGIHADGADIIL